MEYDEFLAKVEESTELFYEDGYRGKPMELHRGNGVNGAWDELCVILDPEGINPAVNLKRLYTRYMHNDDMYKLAHFVKAQIREAIRERHQVSCALDVDYVRDHVICQLINKEKNPALLKEVPHRDYYGMAMIYRVESGGLRAYSGLLTNEIAEAIGIDEEELFQNAAINMKLKYPVRLFGEVGEYHDELAKLGVDKEFADSMWTQHCSKRNVWIMSNKCAFCGAASMLDEFYLEHLAAVHKENMYVLPISTKEIVIVGGNDINPDDLTEYARTLQNNLVAEHLKLSDQAFFYNRRRHKLMAVEEARGLIKTTEWKYPGPKRKEAICDTQTKNSR